MRSWSFPAPEATRLRISVPWKKADGVTKLEDALTWLQVYAMDYIYTYRQWSDEDRVCIDENGPNAPVTDTINLKSPETSANLETNYTKQSWWYLHVMANEEEF